MMDISNASIKINPNGTLTITCKGVKQEELWNKNNVEVIFTSRFPSPTIGNHDTCHVSQGIIRKIEDDKIIVELIDQEGVLPPNGIYDLRISYKEGETYNSGTNSISFENFREIQVQKIEDQEEKKKKKTHWLVVVVWISAGLFIYSFIFSLIDKLAKQYAPIMIIAGLIFGAGIITYSISILLPIIDKSRKKKGLPLWGINANKEPTDTKERVFFMGEEGEDEECDTIKFRRVRFEENKQEQEQKELTQYQDEHEYNDEPKFETKKVSAIIRSKKEDDPKPKEIIEEFEKQKEQEEIPQDEEYSSNQDGEYRDYEIDKLIQSSPIARRASNRAMAIIFPLLICIFCYILFFYDVDRSNINENSGAFLALFIAAISIGFGIIAYNLNRPFRFSGKMSKEETETYTGDIITPILLSVEMNEAKNFAENFQGEKWFSSAINQENGQKDPCIVAQSQNQLERYLSFLNISKDDLEWQEIDHPRFGTVKIYFKK